MNSITERRTLFVFSHPNHEFAVLGIIQRLRPWLLYLTDGGGEQRTAQTRQALAEIDLLAQAVFLEYSERSFYDALLQRDAAFFEIVARQVAETARHLAPNQVLCDAIEFYNPVHDISLPIVRRAMRGSPDAEIFEIPLVYQLRSDPERFELQRLPASRTRTAVRFTLSENELATKLRVYRDIYEALRVQMGPLISALPAGHLAVEIVAAASSEISGRPREQSRRYDRRGKILLERGEVKQNITFHEHYLPIARALCHSPSA
jgi:hypothetical protein